jgi:hypothetical protein
MCSDFDTGVSIFVILQQWGCNIGFRTLAGRGYDVYFNVFSRVNENRISRGLLFGSFCLFAFCIMSYNVCSIFRNQISEFVMHSIHVQCIHCHIVIHWMLCRYCHRYTERDRQASQD